jgi:two-component system, cell cycle response regulator
MKILAAEDNPVFQAMLGSLLRKWGYEVVIARDGAEAWAILQSDDAPRLAILDWMMPGVDGPELCRRVRAAAREPYIYILLLTARTQSGDLVEGMEAGADDYLTKPFNAHELRVRLRAGRRIVELQEELLVAREALRDQATHDGLTGLWNRATILEMFQKELARAERSGESVTVAMVDLDRFKQVNDTYGHLAGDIVLRETAGRLKTVMRNYDAVGRYGGEEFLLILPGCDFNGAQSHAERIRQAIGGEPFLAPETPLHMTCSLGFAWTNAPAAADASALIRRADMALYAAKNSGRNRIEAASYPLATSVA